MKDFEAAEQIDEAAYAWIARLDRAGRPPELQAELDAWLAGDARRRGAYLRAEAIWRKLDIASQSPDDAAIEDAPQPGLTRRLVLAGGGTLAAAGIAAAYIISREQVVGTALGEVRRVTLPDNSVMVLNTDSRVGVSMKGEIRRVSLESGEAWFEVKKNPDWPFVVESGRVRVRAVGTAFAVRRLDGASQVSVTEGIVEVWLEGADAARTRVVAGEQAIVAETQPIEARPVGENEIARALAWRTGRIDLSGNTLAEAVAEFNRHNARKLILANDRLASRRVFGLFRTNDPEGFAKAVAVALGTGVKFAPDDILIGG